MTRLLVCGGRRFSDREEAWRILDEEHAASPVVELIVGDAPGADAIALAWARERGVRRQVHRASWDAFGLAAGPIRNQRMLVLGKPTRAIAFPGGKGTADMVRRLERAGVPTRKAGW